MDLSKIAFESSSLQATPDSRSTYFEAAITTSSRSQITTTEETTMVDPDVSCGAIRNSAEQNPTQWSQSTFKLS